MALTDKQEAFCQEYLIDLNAAAAYRRAKYEVKNENVAAVEGHRLLSNPKIQDRIYELTAERSAAVEMTQEDILRGLKREAEGKGPDTTPSARVKALELLGRRFGMFPNKTEHSGTVTLELVEEIVANADASG